MHTGCSPAVLHPGACPGPPQPGACPGPPLQNLASSPGLCTGPDLDMALALCVSFAFSVCPPGLWDRNFVLFIFGFFAPALVPYTTSVLSKYSLNEMNSSKTKKQKEQGRSERHQVGYQKWFPFPVNYGPLKQRFFLPVTFSLFPHTCHCDCSCYIQIILMVF